LVVLWFYFLLKYLSGHTFHDLLLSGIFLAASVYVRPVGYFLPVIIAFSLSAWIIFAVPQNRGRLIEHVIAFLVVTIGLIVPWQLRNGYEAGYFGFSGTAPDDMYFYNAASVLAAHDRVPFYQMQRRLGYLNERTYFALHPDQKSWSVAQRLEYMNREATHILVRSPFTYARIHFAGVVRVMLDPGEIDLLKFFELYPKSGGLLDKVVDIGLFRTIGVIFLKNPRLFWTGVLMGLFQLVLLSGACVVFFSKRLMRQPQIIAAITVVVYFITISGGPVAVSRYRHAAMPIICVLAGYGLCLAWERLMEYSAIGRPECRED
jgi:hypothetical protein